MTDQNETPPKLPGSEAQLLLEQLATWGNTTTIVLHGGCVFEFKGPFPKGSVAEGYYNLDGPVPGFHGHLRLDMIDHVGFQDHEHRGRPSYAFTFNSARGGNIFKVFLGRGPDGEVIPDQLAAFRRIRERGSVLDEAELEQTT